LPSPNNITRKDVNLLRWRLLLLVSLVSGVFALILWSILAVALFGSARAMAQQDWRLAASLLVPLGVTVLAGVFVYRHTSRRRKLQGLLTTAFVAVMTALMYLVAAQVLPSRLLVPRPSEARHSR